MRTMLPMLLLTVSWLVPASLPAQSPLGESLKDIHVAPHWIYDNLPQAVAEAKATGKPLLVVLRCIPCPPGRTLDVQVMQPDGDLEKLEKQFVCVRIIQTNGLDLKVFQYDYDMSWAAMFLGPDLTIYGRYGTRNASGPQSDTLLSAAGFRKAAERALELHKNYPGNRAQLAGKTGAAPEWSVPQQIPGLQDKPDVATARQNCIHCHMVRENMLRAKWEAGRLAPTDLWVYPMPGRIGLTLDVDDGLLVKSVREDSPAEKAGLAAGDELLSAAGQPLTSTADLQWVLHTNPSDTQLPITLRRKGESLEKTLSLRGGWKQSDLSWRASSWFGLRQGLKVHPLSRDEKKNRGLDADGLALTVNEMFGRGAPKLQAAGLRKGDVIVAMDDQTTAMTESEFLVHLRLAHGPKDAVKLTILRGGNRQVLDVPMW